MTGCPSSCAVRFIASIGAIVQSHRVLAARRRQFAAIRIALLALALACGTLSGMRAFAQEGDIIAKSEKHKLKVVANGGTSWCRPVVKLSMMLDPDSPDLGNPAAQVAVMNMLKNTLMTGCKYAASVELAVIENGAITGTYQASSSSGWTFAATPGSPGAVARIPVPEAPSQVAQLPLQQAPLQTPSTPALSAAQPAPALPAQGSTAPTPLAPPQPTPLSVMPNDFGYASALLNIVAANSALLHDEGVIRWWAAYRYRDEYGRFSNQEFKLQPILDRASADLMDTIARTDAKHVTILVSTQLGTYDFKTQRFPVSFNGDTFNLNPASCCVQPPQSIGFVSLKVEDLDAISGLPMDRESARIFEDARTKFGVVNRSIVLAMSVKMDAGGFTRRQFNNSTGSGVLDAVGFFPDDRTTTHALYVLSTPELEQMRAAKAAEKEAQAKAEEERRAAQAKAEAERHAAQAKAEAERQAELLREQRQAQHDQDIQFLKNAGLSVQLANFISDGPVQAGLDLSNLRSARATYLVTEKPVAVRMLVQMAGSGRTKVPTKWPGKLDISITKTATGLPDFNASGWYLIQGQLGVPKGDDVPDALLVTSSVYACSQPKCTDAADPVKIADRKLGGTSNGN